LKERSPALWGGFNHKTAAKSLQTNLPQAAVSCCTASKTWPSI